MIHPVIKHQPTMTHALVKHSQSWHIQYPRTTHHDTSTYPASPTMTHPFTKHHPYDNQALPPSIRAQTSCMDTSMYRHKLYTIHLSSNREGNPRLRSDSWHLPAGRQGGGESQVAISASCFTQVGFLTNRRRKFQLKPRGRGRFKLKLAIACQSGRIIMEI